MKGWSFYRVETGEFTGRHFIGSERALASNTPLGCGAIAGRFDRLTQRVQDGRVVERVRSQKEVDAATQEARHQAALREIEAIERQTVRPLRELLIDPQNSEARRRLAEAEAQIAALRADL